MARNILGVIVGYLSMAIFIFVAFTVFYLVLGADGAFEPGFYKVSTTWLIGSILLGIISALFGGWICTIIAKNQKAGMILAGIVLVLGIVFALPALNVPEAEMNKVREGTVTNLEAMQNAKQPPLAVLLNPLMGAVGVFIGTKLKKGKKETA